MSIFGGVQVFQILINLVRGKFIAIFLGPAGSGIATLFTSASVSIQQLSSLGIPMALTREVAKNCESKQDIEATVRAGRRAVMFTAFLGMLICGGGAWWLSKSTFGSYAYSWQFVLMAIAVACTLLWNGDQAILQGMRKVSLLSRAALISSVTGLVAGIPLYWLFGTDGIVPAMVILAATMCIFYRRAIKKTVTIHTSTQSVDYSIIKRMVMFGLILMSGQFIGSIVIYAANVYIRSTGTMTDLGNFQAATSICNQYVSLIFAAMAMDYFPRLTAAVSSDSGWKQIVNRQTELVVLLSTPLTILLMSTAPIVVKILLTDSYYPAIALIRWMGAAIFLQSISYPMGYITFAKGNRRLYFWLEGIFANIVYLASTCICYYYWGLIGLGAAAIVRYGIDIIVYYTVNHGVYGFGYDRSCVTIIMECSIYVTLGFIIALFLGGLSCLVCGCMLAIITGYRSYRMISTRLKSDKL